MQIKHASITDKGLRNEINQDGMYEYSGGNIGIFCVADGMGGHSHGEKASAAIADAVKAYAESLGDTGDKGESGIFNQLVQGLSEALDNANAAIYRDYNGGGNICGSTVVILAIAGDNYALLSLGDSRVYLKRGLKLKQLTRDDSVPGTNMLSRAVGTEERIVLHIQSGELKRGDRFLLCSDGIYRFCDDRSLNRILASCKKGDDDCLQNAVLRLRDRTYRGGAGDNLTAILVHVS